MADNYRYYYICIDFLLFFFFSFKGAKCLQAIKKKLQFGSGPIKIPLALERGDGGDGGGGGDGGDGVGWGIGVWRKEVDFQRV
jgi:hypothetical protein